jgi:hypothetical protein
MNAADDKKVGIHFIPFGSPIGLLPAASGG